jgi:hypothetical protein
MSGQNFLNFFSATRLFSLLISDVFEHFKDQLKYFCSISIFYRFNKTYFNFIYESREFIFCGFLFSVFCGKYLPSSPSQ